MQLKSFFVFVSIASLSILGCKTYEPFYSVDTPAHPYMKDQNSIFYVGVPPVMPPIVKNIDEIEVSCQYFKIVVPLVLDRSGKLEGIKNLIDEQFTTALDGTQRYTVMDKTSMLNVWEQQYKTNSFSNSVSEPAMKVTQVNRTGTGNSAIGFSNQDMDLISNNKTPLLSSKDSNMLATTSLTVKSMDYSHANSISDYYGLFEMKPELYEQFINVISKYSDGILKIIITGNDEENHQIDIDYRIISSIEHNKILYSGSGKIGYLLEKGSSSKKLNRDDIKKVTDDIKLQFPNPDIKSMQITDLHGNNKISVNAGKKDNIKEGMVGYVIKDLGTRLAYRAMFIVTEVFPESFNAELKLEPYENIKSKGVTPQDYQQYFRIMNSVRVGESVKMK